MGRRFDPDLRLQRIAEQRPRFVPNTMRRIKLGCECIDGPLFAELRGGSSTTRSVRQPLATITTSGNHHRLVQPDPAGRLAECRTRMLVPVELQFLADPLDALRPMGRMTVGGGVMAVREGDWATMAWAPDEPRLDRWLALYRPVMVGNGGDPTAGHRLPGWANRVRYATRGREGRASRRREPATGGAAPDGAWPAGRLRRQAEGTSR